MTRSVTYQLFWQYVESHKPLARFFHTYEVVSDYGHNLYQTKRYCQSQTAHLRHYNCGHLLLDVLWVCEFSNDSSTSIWQLTESLKSEITCIMLEVWYERCQPTDIQCLLLGRLVKRATSVPETTLIENDETSHSSVHCILKGQTIFCIHNSAWRTATQRVSYLERRESKQEFSSLSEGAFIKLPIKWMRAFFFYTPAARDKRVC